MLIGKGKVGEKRKKRKLKALNPSKILPKTNCLTNSRYHNWHPTTHTHSHLRNIWDSVHLALSPKKRQLISLILCQERYHLPEVTNVVIVDLFEELDKEHL